MANAGTIEVSLKATGSAQFIAQVQAAVDKLRGVDTAANKAGDSAAKLGGESAKAAGKMGRLEKAASAAAAAAGAFVGLKFANALAQQAHSAVVATQAFKALGGNIESLRKATGGMISDAELVKKANLAQTMGINNAAFEKMAVIAQASAAKTGQSMEYLFESIVIGSARQSKMILDNLGIMINVDKANQDYARSLGLTSNALNDQQKKQAFLNAVMAQGDVIMKQMADAGIDLRNPFAVFSAAVDNASVTLGKVFIPVFQKLFAILEPVFDLVSEFGKVWDRMTPGMKSVVGWIGAVAGVLVTLPVLITGVSSALGLMKAVLISGARSAMLMFLPLVKVALLVGALVSVIGVVRVAWEENWGGMKTATQAAWKWIKDASYQGIINVVALFYYLRDGGAFALSKLGQLVITFLFAPVELTIKALDLLMGAFRGVMRAAAGVFAAMNMDTEANTFMRAADSLETAMGDVTKAVGDARDALMTKIDVKAPDWKANQAEAKGTVDMAGSKVADMVQGAMQAIPGLWDKLKSAGGDMATKFLSLVGQGWALIAKDLGLELLPEDAAKKAGKALGGSAAGTISEELRNARREFAGIMEDLRGRDAMMALQDPFRSLKQVSVDTAKELRDVAEKARKAGMGMDEARTLILRNAGREMAERVNGITSLAQWNAAVGYAAKEAAAMGVDFNDVASNLKFQPADVSDVMTQRVGEAFDAITGQMGMAIGAGDRQSIVDTISKGIAELLKNGKLDFDSIGKALGQLFGATGVGSDLIAGLTGMAGKAMGGATGSASSASQMLSLMGAAGPGGLGMLGALGGGGGVAAAGAGGAAGAGAGGLTGMLGGPAGAAIGAAVVGVIAAAAPMVLDAFKQVAEGILNAAQAVPAAISGLIGKVAELIPVDKLKGLAGEAFSPMVIGIGLVVGALVALSVPLMLVGSVILGALMPAILILGAAFMISLPFLIIVTAAMAMLAVILSVVIAMVLLYVVTLVATIAAIYMFVMSLVSAVVMLMTPIGALAGVLAVLFIPVLIAAAAILAVFVAAVAVVVGTIGLFIAFLKLATETKSFERFKKAFEASIGRITTALEPLFENLLPLAGLFDALVSVVIPLAAAFANNEAAARMLFNVLKFVAVVLGTVVMAIGYFVSALLAGVIAVAGGLSGFIKSTGFAQNALNKMGDGMLRAGSSMIQAILWAFWDVLPDSIRTALGNASSRMAEAIGTGAAVSSATGTLDDIAAAARGLSPDLDAMGQALADLTNLTYDEAMTRASILAREKEMSESLTNVPQGFKVAAARFRAIAADTYGTGALPGETAGGGGGSNFFIDTVLLRADDPDDMAVQLERAAERRNFQQAGTTGTSDGQNNGT